MITAIYLPANLISIQNNDCMVRLHYRTGNRWWAIKHAESIARGETKELPGPINLSEIYLRHDDHEDFFPLINYLREAKEGVFKFVIGKCKISEEQKNHTLCDFDFICGNCGYNCRQDSHPLGPPIICYNCEHRFPIRKPVSNYDS